MYPYRFLLLLFLYSPFAMAQGQLQATVDRWAADDYLRHASVGVCVTDAATGKVLAGYRSATSLIPASTLKVLTTASALAMLGADFRFTTTLAYDGYVDNQGVLNGNLYLVGSGDPSLGSPEMKGTAGLEPVLDNWRLAIQQAGIRQVTGRAIGDDLVFSSAATGSHWPWLDLGNYYGSGAYGLNLHDNLYYLRLQQQTRLGATPPVAGTAPRIPGLQFYNEITSAERGSGDNAYIYGAPYTYQRYLRGTIPVGSGIFTIKGAIPDPPLFAAQQLVAALESVGILCLRPPASLRQLPATDQPAAPRQVLHTHKSPTVAALATYTNMESINLYAEALLRAIGREYGGSGSAEAGLQAIQDYWTRRGVDFAGVQLYDGSGLAARNVVPGAFLCQLLSVVYQDQQLRQIFMDTLPLAGWSGSLRNSLKGTAAEGRLRAKSGSLEQVRAYTGYVPDRQGRVLAFSMLLNNYSGESDPARKKLLDLMAALAEAN